MAPAGNLFDMELLFRAALQLLTVDAPRLTVGSALALTGTTQLSRTLPGVFARPVSHANVDDAGAQLTQTENWEIVCAVPLIIDKQSLANTYQAIGELGWAVVQVVRRQIPGARYTGFSEVFEGLDRVELPLQFEVDTASEHIQPANLADFARFVGEWDLAAPDGRAEAVDDIDLPIATEDKP